MYENHFTGRTYNNTAAYAGRPIKSAAAARVTRLRMMTTRAALCLHTGRPESGTSDYKFGSLGNSILSYIICSETRCVLALGVKVCFCKSRSRDGLYALICFLLHYCLPVGKSVELWCRITLKCESMVTRYNRHRKPIFIITLAVQDYKEIISTARSIA